MRAQLLDPNTVGLFFAYDPRIVSVVKQIQGRKFEPRLKAWTFARDGQTLEHLRKLQKAGFLLDEQLQAILLPPGRIAPVLEPPTAPIRPQHPIFGKLYPFQADSARWMIAAQSGLVCSFCGSGKTITTLAALTELACARTLIVCPKSVLYNWQREIKMWLDLPATVITGAQPQRVKLYGEYSSRFLIITYDTLRIDEPFLTALTFDAVIFDEVHYLVNTTSQRHKAAAHLHAPHKFGLTATPIMNSALDIYGVTKAVGKDLGNYKLFMDRYCEKDLWGSVKYFKHLDELARRIRPWLIQKTLADTHFELPPRTDTDLEFELSEQETSLYDRIKKELLFEIEAAEVSKLSSPMILQNSLVKLGKLQELVDYPGMIGDTKQATKLEILKEHLENNLNDQKAIIFTRFSRMAEILGRELGSFNPVVLTGATQNRQEEIDRFTNDSKARIFISTEAGGAGINLQAASIVYNYDLPFSLGKLEQRNGRIRHHMQDRPVFFYNLIAKLKGGKQTIDSFVKNKIIKKQEISDRLLLSDIKELLSV